MSPHAINLVRFVTLASLVAAGLLANAHQVVPEQKGLWRRFLYFFVRSFVTVGFWAALLWNFSDGTDRTPGLP